MHHVCSVDGNVGFNSTTLFIAKTYDNLKGFQIKQLILLQRWTFFNVIDTCAKISVNCSRSTAANSCTKILIQFIINEALIIWPLFIPRGASKFLTNIGSAYQQNAQKKNWFKQQRVLWYWPSCYLREVYQKSSFYY
ncbi:unnamed protein product [Paramecium octaurelia]|uniref:Uncharacterized protein n=1 Tax=Paramecium octaurelia TaxID=43137 RepID=A0A8S1X1Y5_PAROT|nr:unnamed protein product [Paramecium octaurelia]